MLSEVQVLVTYLQKDKVNLRELLKEHLVDIKPQQKVNVNHNHTQKQKQMGLISTTLPDYKQPGTLDLLSVHLVELSLK